MVSKFEKVIIMTDLHLRKQGSLIIGLDPIKKFSNALDHALLIHPDAKRLIIIGDLTHQGLECEYHELRLILRKVKIPISLMLGNHDVRSSFVSVFPEIPLDKNGFVQSSFTFKNYLLLFLDTLKSSSDYKAKHEGVLCKKRLDWVKSKLDESKKKKVLIFMHHPPFKVGFKAMDKIRLSNDLEFLSLISKYSNIQHLFAGHVHRTISGKIKNFSFSMFKSTCHQMPMAINSNNTSLSTNEPSAYGILFLSKESIIVHTEDHEIARNSEGIFEDY